MLRQGAVLGELAGEVERGAAAQRGQHRVRLLALDHLRNGGRQQRLDVSGRGELRVGHDRGRVRVDEDHLVALLEQHLAGLRARVVELGGLADHDRAGADHEDLLDVVSTRHQEGAPRRSRNRSKRCRASWGPGPASGWYCTVEPGTSRRTRPSTVRSYRFSCWSSAVPKSVSQRTGSSASIVDSPPGPSTANPWFCEVISMRPVSRSFTG